jgi:hypothetical protein
MMLGGWLAVWEGGGRAYHSIFLYASSCRNLDHAIMRAMPCQMPCHIQYSMHMLWMLAAEQQLAELTQLTQLAQLAELIAYSSLQYRTVLYRIV